MISAVLSYSYEKRDYLNLHIECVERKLKQNTIQRRRA